MSIFLSNGSSFLLFSEDASLFTGNSTLDEDAVHRLENLQNCFLAFRKGLELCAGREHSVLQIKQKLLKRQFSQDAADTAIRRLIRMEALDDSRYADVWVRAQIRSLKKNRFQLEGKLREAGIQAAIIKNVLEEYHNEEYEMAVLEKAVEKLKRKYKNAPDKCIAALLRRGFSYRMTRKFIQR